MGQVEKPGREPLLLCFFTRGHRIRGHLSEAAYAYSTGSLDPGCIGDIVYVFLPNTPQLRGGQQLRSIGLVLVICQFLVPVELGLVPMPLAWSWPPSSSPSTWMWTSVMDWLVGGPFLWPFPQLIAAAGSYLCLCLFLALLQPNTYIQCMQELVARWQLCSLYILSSFVSTFDKFSLTSLLRAWGTRELEGSKLFFTSLELLMDVRLCCFNFLEEMRDGKNLWSLWKGQSDEILA